MMKNLRPVTDERGIALVMALLVLIVLTIVITGTISYTTQSQHESGFSKAKSYAYVLAENGINEAESILNDKTLDPVTGSGINAFDPTVFCTQTLPSGTGAFASSVYTPSPPPSTGCTIQTNYDGGYVKWSPTFNSGSGTWSVSATGYVTNPTGSAIQTRTITATVRVRPTIAQRLNTPVWNYLYSTKTASAPNVCDMSVTSSAQVASPLYVEGNLCFSSSSNYTGTGPLVVKGRLSLLNGNLVGSSAQPVSSMFVGNQCVYQNNGTPGACQTSGTRIYTSNLLTSAPSGVAPPTVNWDNWYLNASPGPYFACTTTSGTPPTFDSPVAAMSASDATKLTYQNNNQVTQNLTPAASYTCKTAAGELSWNASTNVLTISGTIFVDGNLYIQNGNVNRYQGQGVIYLSGSMLIKNSQLCAVIYNGSCDLRTYNSSNPSAGGWDPNQNLIAFIANGAGGQSGVGTGESIVVTGGNGSPGVLQGAAFGTYDVTVGSSGNIDGPMVGRTVNLGQSVTTNFPSITVVPNGMPSNPTAYAQPDPPSGYTG